MAIFQNKRIIPLFEEFGNVPLACQTAKGIDVGGMEPQQVVDAIQKMIIQPSQKQNATAKPAVGKAKPAPKKALIIDPNKVVDLDLNWVLLMGTPTVVEGHDGWGQPMQTWGNKKVDECHVSIKGSKLMITDKKGKKEVLTLDLLDVTGIQKANYKIGVSHRGMLSTATRVCVIISYKDGKIFSLTQTKDETDYLQNQLITAMNVVRGE